MSERSTEEPASTPRWRCDPLFAATLLRQLSAPEALNVARYPAPRKAPKGVIVNLKT